MNFVMSRLTRAPKQSNVVSCIILFSELVASLLTSILSTTLFFSSLWYGAGIRTSKATHYLHEFLTNVLVLGRRRSVDCSMPLMQILGLLEWFKIWIHLIDGLCVCSWTLSLV